MSFVSKIIGNNRFVGKTLQGVSPVALRDPSWAPLSIRKLGPVFGVDYVDNELWNAIESYDGATARRLTDPDNPLNLESFAAGVERKNGNGLYLETFPTDRLWASGDSPATGLASVSNAVITALAGNPHGSYNAGRIATGAVTSINAFGRTGAFSAVSGEVLTLWAIMAWGTSGRFRVRLSSTAGNTTVSKSGADAFAYPDTVNGVATAEFIDLGNGLFMVIVRVTLTTTQADFRWNIGPNLATAGADVVVYAVHGAKNEHPLTPITTVATAAAESYALDITGLGTRAIAGTFVLRSWKLGTVNPVIAQLDAGSDADRVVIQVDKATLLVHVRFIVGGVQVEELILPEPIVRNAPFAISVSWDANSWSAQIRNGTRMTSVAAGTMPELTTMRYGESVTAGNESAVWIRRVFGIPYALTAEQMAAAIAGAAQFIAVRSVTQTELDVVETLNGEDYIKDSFAAEWAIQQNAENPKQLRFETRLGYKDKYDYDGDREYSRSELHSSPDLTPDLVRLEFSVTPIDISNALPMFEEDGVTRRPYTQINVTQLKGSPDPTGAPMLALNINSDGYRIVLGGGDAVVGADGNDRTDFYFKDEIVPVVGRTDKFRFEVQPGIPGVSYVKMWYFDELVLDEDGFYIGYPETDSMFIKFGLYCHDNIGDAKVLITNPTFTVG